MNYIDKVFRESLHVIKYKYTSSAQTSTIVYNGNNNQKDLDVEKLMDLDFKIN